MTDLEITKRCAEAMGYLFHTITDSSSHEQRIHANVTGGYYGLYDPLHDDAQVMALVKKFQLGIFPYFDGSWDVRAYAGTGEIMSRATQIPDLNRAICECVAKLQASK